MKLRHGQLWQRLGLAILSGILVATLAPSTAAAPTDGHEMHSDAESADLEIEGDLEDRIAAVVGHVDMLKAGHHGRATSNSESFMATLSPSMIIQTNLEWVTPDRLTTLVTVSGTASWAPTAGLWDRARIPAVVGTFTESGISYNDLSAASWGHEYYQGVTPRAWWFQGARPVDVRLVEELVRQLVLLCGSPLLCDEPVGERSRHLVLDGFHRRYGDRMDLRRKLPIVSRRQGESDRSGVAERRRELALFRRRSCVNRMDPGRWFLVLHERDGCHGHRYAGY